MNETWKMAALLSCYNEFEREAMVCLVRAGEAVNLEDTYLKLPI